MFCFPHPLSLLNLFFHALCPGGFYKYPYLNAKITLLHFGQRGFMYLFLWRVLCHLWPHFAHFKVITLWYRKRLMLFRIFSSFLIPRVKARSRFARPFKAKIFPFNLHIDFYTNPRHPCVKETSKDFQDSSLTSLAYFIALNLFPPCSPMRIEEYQPLPAPIPIIG